MHSLKPVLVILLLNSCLTATIINIPADSLTIQSGINGASNGDTVLVQPGTYVERISFAGKNIVVGSLFLTTSDTAYITKTIIDGNHEGIVVTFNSYEDTTAKLIGFTITGGWDELYSSAILITGGTPFSNATVEYCQIKGNAGERSAVLLSAGVLNCSYLTIVGNDVFHALELDGGTLNGHHLTIANNSNWGIRQGGPGDGIVNLHSSILRNRQGDSGGTWNITYSNCLEEDLDYINDDPTNIYRDPLFCDPDGGVYTLAQNSPCIGTGLDGTNMGALGIGCVAQTRVWNISVNVSDNTGTGSLANPFATIQKGIDSSNDGDTVLVQPGAYVENIDFGGKGITVGSLFLTTGDTSFISQTVIDGASSGSVVTFENGEDSTAVLTGFSIVHGLNKRGGGIFCTESSPSLIELQIRENAAEYGGGISFILSGSRLSNVTITDNIASVRGGGLHCSESSELYFSGVQVKQNIAIEKGGGIYSTVFSQAHFDTEHRCSIHSNRSPLGNDLYVMLREIESTTWTVVLDTFSVMVPTECYAIPREVYTFDILHGIIEQVEADLYISPDGSDANSGLSSAEPLQTLAFARSIIVADSLHPRTIHLAKGLYSSSATGEAFPVGAISHVSYSGATRDQVTLDAEGQSSVIVADRTSGSAVSHMTVTGGSATSGGGIKCWYSQLNLASTSVTGNISDGNGGGIYIQASDPTLADVRIADNTAKNGGGISCVFANPILENVQICTNHASSAGGGVAILGSDPSFAYTTISENSAVNAGGGIYLSADSNPHFNAESRSNIYLNHAPSGSDLHADTSPYGTPDTVIVDTFTVLEPTDQYANPVTWFTFDILHAKQEVVEINVLNAFLPKEFSLHSAYPNPFNPVSTIRYELPQSSEVSLIVYDLLGREVVRLVDGTMEPGYHEVQWNGKESASGIYIARLVTPEYSKSIKMLLLK